MTDLKNQLMRLFADEPNAPDDIESIVGAGRRARRRRQVAVVTAGTLGAASVGAAVAVPLLTTGGNGHAAKVGVQSPPKPMPTASAPTGPCYIAIPSGNISLKREIAKLRGTGKLGAHPTVTKLPKRHGQKALVEVCAEGVHPVNPATQQESQGPAGPPYHYSEDPSAIASRFGTHLHNRVADFGLTISYTRPFAQESANLDKGHPSYFDGNVDIRESNGYGDIGVQVSHTTTEQVPFDGECATADHCVETTLPDGSVLRTGQVDAGRGDTILTAEIHRPDGVVVQAQESDYPFGPDAGTQTHGDQPLTLDQLVSLAKDVNFTF
jgi:hypothetical protein